MVSRVFMTSLFCFFFILSCSSNENREVVLQLGSLSLIVEIADTPEKTEKGLMFRRRLPANRGMLFAFRTDEIRGFWMKNTHIPLSIAYIDYNGKIREIYDMEPENLDPVTSRFPFRYALEVNKGFFQRSGVKIGDKIDLSNL